MQNGVPARMEIVVVAADAALLARAVDGLERALAAATSPDQMAEVRRILLEALDAARPTTPRGQYEAPRPVTARADVETVARLQAQMRGATDEEDAR